MLRNLMVSLNDGTQESMFGFTTESEINKVFNKLKITSEFIKTRIERWKGSALVEYSKAVPQPNHKGALVFVSGGLFKNKEDIDNEEPICRFIVSLSLDETSHFEGYYTFLSPKGRTLNTDKLTEEVKDERALDELFKDVYVKLIDALTDITNKI